AFAHEVDFILNESARYLRRAPTAADVKSHWVGLRPLVKPDSSSGEHTQGISREHTVLVSASGLVTVTGGKWTTYRAMAEDVLKKCRDAGLLPGLADGHTDQLALVGAAGAPADQPPVSAPPGAHGYGGERDFVWSLPGADRELGGGLTEAMVRFAVRFEYARTVEDVLARRSRLLFLDAALAASLADEVGAIVAQETGRDPQVGAFVALARQHLALPV
ncbi:MAG TPA: glycerol-3-phosphate dehydrogenase C-terminal domain-containing protein, partial [Burkholderiaceae bacterium]|nr:glycerol-3-phosphate dehydrogenase C-terminal domain-containing protein [Burkholderiaceae bacterium]